MPAMANMAKRPLFNSLVEMVFSPAASLGFRPVSFADYLQSTDDIYRKCNITEGVELQVSVYVSGFEVGQADRVSEGLVD